MLVGFVPHLPQTQLPPELMLLVLLPALLYWESLTTSLREIRNNLRVVLLTSTALVVATAAVVAAAAHGLGLEWGPALVLGAALAGWHVIRRPRLRSAGGRGLRVVHEPGDTTDRGCGDTADPHAFWSLSTTVLSSALFVLVGVSAQAAFRGLDSASTLHALVAVTAVVIGVRWVWLYTTPYLIRLLDRRPAQRLRRVPARQRRAVERVRHELGKDRKAAGSRRRGGQPVVCTTTSTPASRSL